MLLSKKTGKKIIDQLREVIGAFTHSLTKDIKGELSRSERSVIFANRISLTVGGIGLFLGVIFAYFMSRSIIKPIGVLQKGTELIGDGDLNHRIKLGNQDEIGKLADSFNRMTEELQQRTNSLNDINKQLQSEITERKQVEEMAKQHQAELAHVSRLCNVGEMASSLAHEVNQPLTAINTLSRGCLQIMQSEGQVNPKIYEAIEEIATQAERSGEIIKRIRGFVSKQQPQRGAADINDIVQASLSFIETEIKQHHIAIHLDLDREMCAIQVDSIQIEQVILNILLNGIDAMKSMPQKSRELTVQTLINANQDIEVMIKDIGVGLTDEATEHLFDSFFTTKPEGLGIGLSLSRRIVEAHGGQLWASSNPEKGATFRFTLPINN